MSPIQILLLNFQMAWSTTALHEGVAMWLLYFVMKFRATKVLVADCTLNIDVSRTKKEIELLSVKMKSTL